MDTDNNPSWDSALPLLTAPLLHLDALLDIVRKTDAPRELFLFAAERLEQEARDGSDPAIVAVLIQMLCQVLRRIKTKKYKAFMESFKSALFPHCQMVQIMVGQLADNVDGWNDTTAHSINLLTDSFVDILNLCNWILNESKESDENASFNLLFQDIASDVCYAVIYAFPTNSMDNNPQLRFLFLDLCARLNRSCAQAFDYLSLDLSRSINTPFLPFILKHYTSSNELNLGTQEWIPQVFRAGYLLSHLSPWIADCLTSSDQIRVHYSVLVLKHFYLSSGAIVLTSRDLESTKDIQRIITSLLNVLATNPNQKEREPILSCFQSLYLLFDEDARYKLLNLVMTHDAVNIRSYGIYLYKNELVKQRASGAEVVLDPRIAKLVFSIDSAMFESKTYQEGRFLENDDIFFEMVPLIAQCVNFLSYLHQVVKGDSQASIFRSLSSDFVDLIRQRVKVMLHSRQEALKSINDATQCNYEISTLSLLMFQMERF